MSARAVIFDLDGTLLDTLEDLADAGNNVLAALGYPTHPMESYKQFVGDGVAMLVRRALPEDAQHDFDRALERMREEYATHWKVKTRPYPGIAEMLDALVAKGVPLSVLSNKPDKFCQLTMEHFFSRWPWAAVMGESEKYPRKPDPTGAKAIAEKLGIPPGDFLFLGDSPMDVKCALGAGMTPVGATWGFRERATLEAAGGKVFIDRPQELLRLI
ncbi:HAD family hydrolase [Fundidesulfovibrio terrae]|uniref:HAD family hydrolase n=1 Tax=Fundidesulfovibrio terrae TaxID=2922866 RepID=UPI001FAF85D1|nr:HAD family hydrolase [Fundidesulfovibrio terrae]